MIHDLKRQGLSVAAIARKVGHDRKTVSKILKHSVPPGYRREGPPVRAKLDPFVGISDRILGEDTYEPRFSIGTILCVSQGQCA